MINLIGKKVKIVTNTSGHGIPIGTVGIIKSKNPSNQNQYYLEGNASWFYEKDVEVLSMTKADLDESISKLENEIAELKTKQQFMADNNLEEFDGNQYKVFIAISTLNDNSSIIEKAKVIAGLINN